MSSTRRVIVFRSRLRAGVEEEYGRAGEATYALATTMPGMLASKDFVAEDGERLTIVEFDSPEHLLAWRDHPDHRRVQAQGREQWYAEYSLQVCEVVRSSRFDAATGRHEQAGAEPTQLTLLRE